MWNKEAIEKFMRRYGFNPSYTKSEIKELPEILNFDEVLCGLLEGFLKKVHNRDINGTGLVIATNKRIIFFRKTFIGTVTKEEIPVSKISSSSYRKGILFGSIAIVTSNNEAVVEQCDKENAKKFIDSVQKVISEHESSQRKVVPPAIPQSANDKYAIDLNQLEKIFDLKQKGILTEEEYLTQKAKILGI